MTFNEANLLLTLFFAQHKGKRLCDVIINCQNRDVIYSVKKFKFEKALSIIDNLSFSLIGYDYEYGFGYFTTTHSNTNGRFEYFDITQYISFKDQV